MTNNYSDNIAMLNVLIALCFDGFPLPDVFRKLGYNRDSLILERTVRLGNGGLRPDLIMASSKIGSVICVESKSGNNIDVPQAQRYSNLKSDYITQATGGQLNCDGFTIDVCYVCTSTHTSRISKGLSQVATPLSLLSFTEHGIAERDHLISANPSMKPFLSGAAKPLIINLSRDYVQHILLHNVLCQGIGLDLRKVPPIYRFDSKSEYLQIAPHVRDAIIRFAASGRSEFTTTDLAESAYGNMWSSTDAEERRQVVKLVRDWVDKIRRKGFKRILQTAKSLNTHSRVGEESLSMINEKSAEPRLRNRTMWHLTYYNTPRGRFSPTRILRAYNAAVESWEAAPELPIKYNDKHPLRTRIGRG